MELYFVENLDASSAVLVEEQYRHAIKVMRKREGDRVILTNGQGIRAIGRVTAIGKKEATLAIDEFSELSRPPYRIDVAVALTKNIKRIEWAFEKMTEMGVTSIHPIICRRSERDRANMDRLEKILISALKQSGQYHLPYLHAVTPFAAFCQREPESVNEHKFIAHLSEESGRLQDNYIGGNDVCIMIGPEGDFTADEVALALDSSYRAVTLGSTRLRTETAAVAAVAYIHALND